MNFEQELNELLGEHFWQIAFYNDNRIQNNIGRYWIKIETDQNGDYKAWQVRDIESFEQGYSQLIERIKEWNNQQNASKHN